MRLLVRPRPSCDCWNDSRIVPDPLAIDAHFALALRSRRTPAPSDETAPTGRLARGAGALVAAVAAEFIEMVGWPAIVSESSAAV